MPSTTVRSFAFLSENPAFLAAARSITVAGFGAALDADALGADAFGMSLGTAALATGAAFAGAAAAVAAGAGTSANLVGAAGVLDVLVINWLVGALQQHLHINRLSNQPIKPPSKSQNQQHDIELKNELIFTPQKNDYIRLDKLNLNFCNKRER